MQNFKVLARAAGAYHRCVTSNNTDWQARWFEQIQAIVKDHFPSGSGFDAGTQLDLEASNDEVLVFKTAFHHMNDGGMYDGWTEHTIKVKPSLGLDYHLTISGRDRNGIKEYISECFSQALSKEQTAQVESEVAQ